MQCDGEWVGYRRAKRLHRLGGQRPERWPLFLLCTWPKMMLVSREEEACYRCAEVEQSVIEVPMFKATCHSVKR